MIVFTFLRRVAEVETGDIPYRVGERRGVDRRLPWDALALGAVEVRDIGGRHLGQPAFLKGCEIELFGAVLNDALTKTLSQNGEL